MSTTQRHLRQTLILELDADPLARRKLRAADEAHQARATVKQLDPLAHRHLSDACPVVLVSIEQ